MNASTPTTGTPAGRRAEVAAQVREDLVAAAIVEFASHGFAGASTRAIARRAGCHQPQINYHFDSKEALWQAAVERLLAELDELLVLDPTADPRDQMAAIITSLVVFAARRPELNRIMVHVATDPGPRLEWLVETHLRGRVEAVLDLWRTLVDRGDAAAVPEHLLHHVLIGASTLLHANAPEARLLFGFDPSADDVVADHAAALIAMFLPESRKQH